MTKALTELALGAAAGFVVALAMIGAATVGLLLGVMTALGVG